MRFKLKTTTSSFDFEYSNGEYKIYNVFTDKTYSKKDKWITDNKSYNYYIILDLIADSLVDFKKVLDSISLQQKVEINFDGLDEFVEIFEDNYKTSHKKNYLVIKNFL